MASVTIVLPGPPEQRHVVKVSPMSRLRDALKEASTKFRPALDPARCALTFSSKPVDLDTPFRMLNLPANPRLEVLKVTAPAEQAGPRATAAEAHPAADGPGGNASDGNEQQQHQQQQQRQEQQEQQQQQQQQQEAAQRQQEDAAAATAAAQASTSGQQTQQQQQGLQDAGAGLQALGITVPLHVFNQGAVEAVAAAAAAAEAASMGQASTSSAADDDESFYEFTPEDFARVHRAAEEKKKHDSQFRGKGLREAEERARAEAFGLVPVRFHFPDRSIVQASFPATEPIASLQALVGSCLAPQLLQNTTPSSRATTSTSSGAKGSTPVSKGYYLYIAPPKTVLKDGEVALWQAGLLPAAHVYVALDASNPAAKDFTGPYLRPEVQALMQDTVPQPPNQQQQAADAGAGNGSDGAGGDVAAAKRAHAASSGAGVRSGRAGGGGQGAKLPKWFGGK